MDNRREIAVAALVFTSTFDTWNTFPLRPLWMLQRRLKRMLHVAA